MLNTREVGIFTSQRLHTVGLVRLAVPISVSSIALVKGDPCEYVADRYIAKNYSKWVTLGGIAKIAHCYWLHQSGKREKNADYPLIPGSGSFKVTDFGTKLVDDFL